MPFFFLCPLGHSIEKSVTKDEIDADVSGIVAELELDKHLCIQIFHVTWTSLRARYQLTFFVFLFSCS